MEDKLYELKLRLKEVQGSKSQVHCRVEIGEESELLDAKEELRLEVNNASPEMQLSIMLLVAGRHVGTSKITLKALLGSVPGSAEKWIRLRSEGGDIRIKIGSSIQPIETSNVGFRERKNEEEARCPFLEGEVTSEKPSEEHFKTSSEDGRILINIEGDYPGSVDTTKYNLPPIDEIDFENLSKMTGTQLKKALKDLCTDLKGIINKPEEHQKYKEQINQKVAERLQVQESSEETTLGLKSLWQKEDSQADELLLQRQQLVSEFLSEQNLARELQYQLTELRASIAKASQEKISLGAQELNFESVSKAAETLNQMVKESTSRKEHLEKEVQEAKKSMECSLNKFLEKKEELLSAKVQSDKDLESLKSQKASIDQENQQLKEKLNQLKAKLKQENLFQLAQNSKSAFEDQEAKRQETQSKLEELETLVETQNSEFKAKTKELLSEKKKASETIGPLEKSIEAKEQEILELRKDIYENSNKQITLEQSCCIKADLAQLIDDLGKLHRLHSTGRDLIMQSLNNGTDYVMNESQVVLDESTKLNLMINSINEKDFEVENLKQIMSEIKQRVAPYYPVQDDPIDVALSEYLNTREEPIHVGFKRTQEGEYYFGTKRVFIGLENGSIKVRVGGGYTGIEEFIEVYTPLELERQEVAVGESNPMSMRTLSRFIGSPSPSMTPVRASRIIHSTVESISQGSPPRPVNGSPKKLK